jgi:hypothetical protein
MILSIPYNQTLKSTSNYDVFDGSISGIIWAYTFLSYTTATLYNGTLDSISLVLRGKCPDVGTNAPDFLLYVFVFILILTGNL